MSGNWAKICQETVRNVRNLAPFRRVDTLLDRRARGGDHGGGDFKFEGGGCGKRVVNDKYFGRPPEISGNFGKYWVKK